MTFTPSVLSKVDANNTTKIPLGVGVPFTGAPTLTTGYDTLMVTVKTSQPSVAGGLQIQFADDSLNFDTFFADTVFANIPFTNTYTVLKKYYRIQYVSDGATGAWELTTRITPQLDSTALSQSNNISVFDNAVEQTLDAFGKHRVTTPTTLIDIRFPAGATPLTPQPILQNTLVVNQYSTSGGAWSAVTSGNGTLVLIANAGAPPGVTLSQSRTFVTYQPGKSLLMLFSGVFRPSNDTYQSAVGLFDTDVTTPIAGYVNNGVYLSFAAGVPALNVTASGTATSFPQSVWNVDKFDGSGPSQLTLDFTKAQLFVIDLEWLGVGRIRFGFYAFGKVQYCHQVTNINALTGPYTPTMNLPVTYMLWSAAPVGGSSSITQVCSTVISEGGYSPVGRPFSANTGSNAATEEILVNTTERALLAIRGRVAGGYYHQTIVPVNFSVIETDNNNTLLVRLRYYPAAAAATSIVATTWTPANSLYSLVEYAQGQVVAGVNNFTTFLTTGSVVVTSSYILGKGSNVLAALTTAFTNLLLNLSADVTNRPGTLVLTAQRVGSGATTAKVWASLDWQEIY